MSSAFLLLVLAIVLVGGLIVISLLNSQGLSSLLAGSAWRQQVRNLSVSRQTNSRGLVFGTANSRSSAVLESVDEAGAVEKVADTALTLRKKLKYAQLSKVPPYAFGLAQVGVSFVAFLLARQFFHLPLQLISLLTGPLFMNWLLNLRMDSRYNKFDADYPQFLLSLAGLLKTGLNPIQGLQAAAEGLEEGSLVRAEVELMLERLRLGVPEEKSVGSFGEDVYHPEIELFVQALILSRRVGGNLSDTLDRLSKQVRKRQYFRKSAVAAVGLQRGSIWFILVILAAMELYLFFAWREAVVGPWRNPSTRGVCEYGVMGIVIGMLWVRQVTKIKV